MALALYFAVTDQAYWLWRRYGDCSDDYYPELAFLIVILPLALFAFAVAVRAMGSATIRFSGRYRWHVTASALLSLSSIALACAVIIEPGGNPCQSA